VGIDSHGWLAPLYHRLENWAQSVSHYQKLTLPLLQGISYPTPLHEGHALAEILFSKEETSLAFHSHGPSATYLTELLGQPSKPLHSRSPEAKNPSGIPSLILQQIANEKDGTEEIYFKQLHQELLPPWIQWRQDLAHRQQRLPLLHLERAFELLNEKARWEIYQEELRPRQDWIRELQEEFTEIFIEENNPWVPTLPLRNYSQPGLRRAAHVCLMELGEGIFPKTHGFPLCPELSNDSLAEHEGFLKLRAILFLAERVATFSYVEQDMEGRIQRPSPLWELFIEPSLEQKAKTPALLPTGYHPYFQENLRRETQRLHLPAGALDQGDLRSLKLRPLLEAALKDHPLSATYLDDYAKCPWKFFARRLLKMDDAMEWILEIEPKLKGRLHHGLLEKVYQHLIKKEFSQGKIPGIKEREEALEQSLQSCLEDWKQTDEFKKLPARLRKEEIQRLTSRVRRFLQLEAEAWEKAQIPLFPQKLEWRFGKSPHPTVVFPLRGGGGVPLAGAVDRVDYNSLTGEYLLLDYKASSSDELARQLREGLSYQLFLYLFAVGQALFPEGKALGALYGDLKKIKKNQGMAQREGLKPFGLARANNKSFLDGKEFSAFQERLTGELEEILQNILEGIYPLNPKECQGERCPYHEICRYDHQPR
jgi:RecB family exonuclease